MKNKTLEELLLLDEIATQNTSKRKYSAYLPFHWYVINENIEEINNYIEAGYDINTKDRRRRTALCHAINNHCDVNILKLLIKEGADYHRATDAIPLLCCAAVHGYLDITKYLVEELNLDVNEIAVENRTPLWYSLAFNKLNVAAYLLNHGAKFLPNEENMSLLFWCIYSCYNKSKEKIEKHERKIERYEKKVKKMEKRIENLRKAVLKISNKKRVC